MKSSEGIFYGFGEAILALSHGLCVKSCTGKEYAVFDGQIKAYTNNLQTYASFVGNFSLQEIESQWQLVPMKPHKSRTGRK